MKRFLYILLFLPLPLSLSAVPSVLTQLMEDVRALGGSPAIEAETPNYVKIKLADSCYVEVYHYPDSILFVQTVCAPLCSSVARMYDNGWNLLHAVTAPGNYTLPQAFINEQGSLTWQENYIDETDTLTGTLQ